MKVKETLKARQDFVCLISVEGANPNGDPMYSDGRPRVTSDGRGMITAECIRYKLRRALHSMGENILLQGDNYADDGFTCIKDRLNSYEPLSKILNAKKERDMHEAARLACENWFDVRAFGCLVTTSGKKSLGIRQTVSFGDALSISKIEVSEINITKSTNNDKVKDEKGEDTDSMSSDRMGRKYRVPFGLYAVYGSISPYEADRTGFTSEDAEKIKQAFLTMFDMDISAARPAGTMNVERLYWWDHSKFGENRLPNVSLQQLYKSVTIKGKDEYELPLSMDDYEISQENPKGIVKPEIYGV